MKKLISIVSAFTLVASLFIVPCHAVSLLDKSTFKIRATSEFVSNPATLAVDGDPATYWHTNYVAEGGAIVFREIPPHRFFVELPEKTSISGFTYTPRTDNNNGVAKSYKLYVSEDGKKSAYLVDSGNMPGEMTPFSKSFGFNVSGKLIVFEITSSVGNFGTMAEFDLFAGDSSLKNKEITPTGTNVDIAAAFAEKYISRDNWKISVNSVANGNSADLMKDGSNSTYWHSNYVAEGKTIVSHDEPPFNITVTLPESTYISGLAYTPRQDQTTGRFLKYNIYGKDTESSEPILIAAGDMDSSASIKEIKFNCNVKLRVVIIEATETSSNYGTCAELNLLVKNGDLDTAENVADYSKVYEASKPHIVDKNGFVAIASSDWGDGFKGAAAVDGKNNTYWHSDASKPNDFPYTLDIDMGAEHTLKGIDYLPRFNDTIGHWLEFGIYTSVDGKNYQQVDGENKLIPDDQVNTELKSFEFDAPVKAQYVRFIIEKAFYHHCSCGELTFYETSESAEANNVDKSEKYVLTIGKNVINTLKAGEEKDITIDVEPVIDNSRTLIPLRGLLEAMGASIEWDGETQTIKVTKGKTEITFQIINNLVYVYKYYGGEYKTIRYTLDVPPKIRNSRTFIPLRFVSEHLGYNVEWNGEKGEITITNND